MKLLRHLTSDAARPCLIVLALFSLMGIAEQACKLFGAGLMSGGMP